MKKTLLQEIKDMNRIAGTQMTREQEIVFIKNRLQELEFTHQASFDAYRKNHKMRPDTRVKIAGKETTVKDASKEKSLLQKIGAKLFGKKDKNVQYKDTEREVIDISGKSDDEVVDAITKHVSKL